VSKNESGLPLAVQLTAQRHGEKMLLNVAEWLADGRFI
jgi:Asp-tRNA(Asn)/Glu-tRNA(Gln) amidotransferase A subunit family amidase